MEKLQIGVLVSLVEQSEVELRKVLGFGKPPLTTRPPVRKSICFRKVGFVFKLTARLLVEVQIRTKNTCVTS